jgi:methylenetetrahydrofolate reductase (NADPH)
METLAEKLQQTSDFRFGVELVSIRGSMAEKRALKARDFARELVDCPDVDWVSITDNAGGNPQLAPHALGKPILYAGKEVVIHMTCKDLNRNGLESQAWFLNSEGFHNILAMTGDYPVTGMEGIAKPVFDIDSVGLISMLNRMNQGFALHRKGQVIPAQRLERTQFLIGAVTTNFKLYEGEVMPQYQKLEKKVACGAQFIINQVGYDARKMHELRLYMDHHGMQETPLIGNVYVLNARVAEVFNQGRIPGVVVTDALLERCRKESQSADKGAAFFLELAAKQVAIFRGLGYRGAYFGGVHRLDAIERILEIERTFAADDWKDFAREVSYSRAGEFFYYAEDGGTGLADAGTVNADPDGAAAARRGVGYRFSKWVHETMFKPGHPVSRWGARVCANARNPMQGPPLLRAVEHLSKSALFACKDCGDCSLPDIACLCPESQCAKNQRNGPCGGTREGRCEVDGFGDCIWLRAYERRKGDGTEEDLLEHAPMIQDQGLRKTSAWANHWLGRDHAAKQPALAPAEPDDGTEPRQPDQAAGAASTPSLAQQNPRT